jgi:hypothetical protein
MTDPNNDELDASVPPYTLVNKHNFSELKIIICHLLKVADFVSLDTEFTGLGDRNVVGNIKDK